MNPVPLPINLLIEGNVDDVVARRLIQHVGLTCGRVYGKSGRNYVLERLPNYNWAARFSSWLAVADLNRDPDCPPDLVKRTLPEPASGMRLRIAVHAIEAWLLADAERLAAFLSIQRNRIPSIPDGDPDPKTTMINLARRSRRKAIREDMVPREGSGAPEGRGYSSRLIEFVLETEHQWRPEVAMQRSESLRRCIAALQSFSP